MLGGFDLTRLLNSLLSFFVTSFVLMAERPNSLLIEADYSVSKNSTTSSHLLRIRSLNPFLSVPQRANKDVDTNFKIPSNDFEP